MSDRGNRSRDRRRGGRDNSRDHSRGQGRGDRGDRDRHTRRGGGDSQDRSRGRDERRSQQDDLPSEDEWAGYCPVESDQDSPPRRAPRKSRKDVSRDRSRARDRSRDRGHRDDRQSKAQEAKPRFVSNDQKKEVIAIEDAPSAVSSAADLAATKAAVQSAYAPARGLMPPVSLLQATSRPNPAPMSSPAPSQDVPDWLRDLVGPTPGAASCPSMQMQAQLAAYKPVEPRVVVVPDRFVSKVVGYQGCTVKEIQMMTGTYIQMDQSRVKRDGFGVATITGPTQDNIDAAEMMIKQRIENGIQTQQMYVAGKHGMGKGGRLQMGLGIL